MAAKWLTPWTLTLVWTHCCRVIDLLDFIAFIPLTHFLLQKSWSEFLMNFVVICFCFRQYEKKVILHSRDIIRILQKFLSEKKQLTADFFRHFDQNSGRKSSRLCLILYRRKLTKTTLMQLMHQSLSMSLNWFGTFTHELLKTLQI